MKYEYETTTVDAFLMAHADRTPEQMARFFKTNTGDYADHEIFWGVRSPFLRKAAAVFDAMESCDLKVLLQSPVHEKRLLALMILVRQYQKGDTLTQNKLCRFYVRSLDFVNNWNLVDVSAPHILGAHLWRRQRHILNTLAHSPHLWRRRTAIVATWFFVRRGDFGWTLNIATLLRQDPHRLIHKAVGWMLREIGKKNPAVLVDFLNQWGTQMPKLMLHSALERMPPDQRHHFMKNANQRKT